MKNKTKIFVILFIALLNIISCDSATEAPITIIYEVVSIMGKPVAEYKDYVSENEMFDFPVMFFFESATPPYKGKVLLYKLGVREFYNLTTPGINYFRVNVEGELGILVNGINFMRLDFDEWSNERYLCDDRSINRWCG